MDTYPSFTENETDKTISSENTFLSESKDESKHSDITTKNEESTAAVEHTKSPTETLPSTEKATEQLTQPNTIGNKYVLNTKVYQRPNCRYTEKSKCKTTCSLQQYRHIIDPVKYANLNSVKESSLTKPY